MKDDWFEVVLCVWCSWVWIWIEKIKERNHDREEELGEGDEKSGRKYSVGLPSIAHSRRLTIGWEVMPLEAIGGASELRVNLSNLLHNF